MHALTCYPDCEDAAMPEPTTFSGFDTPKQNWFRMPNEWIDMCAEISSLAELKVVQYVMRHTWGHQEYGIRKRISVDEFMNGRWRKNGERMDKGTGLSKPSVITGLRSSVERGLLIEEVDDSDRARVKKYYSLRMNPESVSEVEDAEEEPSHSTETELQNDQEDGGVKNLNAGVKNLYPDVKKVYPRGKESLPRTQKETLERNNKKEITNNNNGSESTESPVAVVVALASRKIANRVAQQLAEQFPLEYIEEKIAFHDFLVAERPSDIKKPAAWLRSAIENDYSAPDGFISAADREVLANEEKRRNEALVVAQEARQRADVVADQKEREKLRQRLLWLHEKYDTPKDALPFWKAVQEDVKQSAGVATYALIADAYILTLNGATAQVGTTSTFKLSQLAHPGTQTQLNRAASRIAKHEVKLAFVLIEGLPE